ncbi:hypothetical protein H6G06_05470 [Anabaena sphaerica FACHB-251]|uniref:Uncharacterized protein n=1 Tax=Anabaena sphaerica FACHB-251 TaxID=2692883 RepID=A0A926WE91_9NOST|nr:hypothetical protein [Anabaena sphaerica]MBD2292944.1 hypothetical protein [Anabaena sphaerica FACHB-251]
MSGIEHRGMRVKRHRQVLIKKFEIPKHGVASYSTSFYAEPSQSETSLPPGLESYYQQHLQKMLDLTDEDFALAVLKVLAQQTQPISVAAIAEILDTDEYEIEEVLEKWSEFLTQKSIAGTIYYSLYHSIFRDAMKNIM